LKQLQPVDFMLQEMRNPKNPKPMRLELAKWVAPYITPRLSAVAVVKSVRAMTDEELDWAIADAQRPTPRPPGWRPQVIRGNR
jgi:hypothetical protein